MKERNIPNPRSPDAPIRVDDAKMDKQRSAITVGELIAQFTGDPNVAMEPLQLDEIAPERWEALRARRDEILARLREQGLPDGWE